ncbi:MAG TPA: protease complex subunit PrcB family protein [Candidatus Thermoplasmatota archaeon]|jgi:hypothetical protein|nr:protease complex subunit PrcB family protein [Candidatus Thermoplasmatota archaeon]
MRRALLAAALVLLAGCAAPPPPAGETSGSLVIFEHLACASDHPTPIATVALNQSEWSTLWERLCAPGSVGGAPPAEPPLPQVDFTSRWVLASAWGAKSTGGYAVNITSVEELEDNVVVHVERIAPGPNCAAPLVITHPLDIVVAARADKPVRFDHQGIVRACDDAPPPPAGDEGVQAGPWRFTWGVQQLAGPVGPAWFTLRALPNASAPAGQLLPGPWVRLNGSGEAANLTAEGGTWEAGVIVGAVDRATFLVRWGDAGLAELEGPPMATVDPGNIPLRTEARRDAADAGAGLNASAEGGNVTAVFSLGTFDGFDCMEQAALRNASASGQDLQSMAEPGQQQVFFVANSLLRAAIATSSSDACLGEAPAHTPRVILEAGPVPHGRIEVVVYVYHTCFCVPRGGWEEYKVRINV